MRTLDFSDELVQQLERRASQTGTTAEAFASQAIQTALESDPPEKDWRRVFGIMADYKDEIAEIDRVIEEEFGQIEPEMWK